MIRGKHFTQIMNYSKQLLKETGIFSSEGIYREFSMGIDRFDCLNVRDGYLDVPSILLIQ